METNLQSDIIPQLSPGLVIHSVGNEHSLLECNNHQIKVRNQVVKLLSLVNGENNLAEIIGFYNENNEVKITTAFANELFYKTLAPYGILISDTPVLVQERSLHLKLSFIFWKGSSLDFLSRILAPAFNPSVFYPVLGGMSVCSMLLLSRIPRAPSSIVFSALSLPIYLGVSFLILMLHELGHVAACSRFGAKHKGIGFGLYLFAPVFFADVSDTWKLNKWKRIIVNLGGIYFEMIVLLTLLIVYSVCGMTSLYYSAVAVAFHILVNLNPFLKYDGYWILSDLTDTPNLRQKATKALKASLTGVSAWGTGSRFWWLALYGFGSAIIIGLVLLSFLLISASQIVHLPLRVFSFLEGVINGVPGIWIHIPDKILNNSIPLLFYFFIIRFFISGIRVITRKATL
jgi:putative peptide zinc metalloprotease protein